LEFLVPENNYTIYFIGEDNFTKQVNLMRFDQIIQINFTTPSIGKIIIQKNVFYLKMIDELAMFSRDFLNFSQRIIIGILVILIFNF